MIDFTECVEELNSYKGSEKKKTLIYDNSHINQLVMAIPIILENIHPLSLNLLNINDVNGKKIIPVEYKAYNLAGDYISVENKDNEKELYDLNRK